MSVLDGIMVDMSIVLGSANVPIRQVLQMSRGAMIPLESSQDDPSLVYVNDELVAKGVLTQDEVRALLFDAARQIDEVGSPQTDQAAWSMVNEDLAPDFLGTG